MVDTIINTSLLSAATELGKVISNCKQAKIFKEASRVFSNNEDAIKLYNDYVVMQREFRIAEQQGEDTETDYNKLVDLENQLMQNQVFKNYLDVQNAFIDYLKEINQSISEHLPFDFATYAKPAGNSCCS